MSHTSGPEYWWCSVGGNPPEPCTLVRQQKADDSAGPVRAYTARCPDPFDVGDAACPLKLIREITNVPPFNKRDFKGAPVPDRFHGYHNFGGDSHD